jgi:hypothetical protein
VFRDSKVHVRHASRESRREARHVTSALQLSGVSGLAQELGMANQLKVRLDGMGLPCWQGCAVWGTPARTGLLQLRRKKLAFGRSKIHDWGLFAMEVRCMPVTRRDRCDSPVGKERMGDGGGMPGGGRG